IWRTILSSLAWPSECGSAMISLSRRMMMRSAGSLGAMLVSAPPFFCITQRRRFRRTRLAEFQARAPRPRPGPSASHGPYRPPIRRQCGGGGRKAMKSIFAQLVQAMQRAHCQLGVGRIDQHADLDLRGGDGEDVNSLLAKPFEHLC